MSQLKHELILKSIRSLCLHRTTEESVCTVFAQSCMSSNNYSTRNYSQVYLRKFERWSKINCPSWSVLGRINISWCRILSHRYVEILRYWGNISFEILLPPGNFLIPRSVEPIEMFSPDTQCLGIFLFILREDDLSWYTREWTNVAYKIIPRVVFLWFCR